MTEYLITTRAGLDVAVGAVRGALDKLLDDLPSARSSDEIAVRLATLGLRAKCGNVHKCIIAEYLVRETGYPVFVSGMDVDLDLDAVHPDLHRDLLSCDYRVEAPSVLVMFIGNFDAEGYPELMI